MWHFDFINKKKKTILVLIAGNLLSLTAVLFSCFAFSSSVLSQRDACINRLSNEAQNQGGFTYSLIGQNEPVANASGLQRFYDVQQNILFSQHTANYVSFPFFLSTNASYLQNQFSVSSTLSDPNFSTFSLVSFPYFSHNTDYFEGIKMRLLKAIPDEMKVVTGFSERFLVYIPDYYADELIQASGGVLSTYDDLINSNYALYIKDSSLNQTNKYRVANIFYSKGFLNGTTSEKENTPDKGYGEAIRNAIGNFLVVVEKSYFCSPYFCSLIDPLPSSYFMIKRHFDSGIGRFSTNEISTLCFSAQDQQRLTLFPKDYLQNIFCNNTHWFSGINYWFLSAAILVFAAFSFELVYYFKEKEMGLFSYLLVLPLLFAFETIFEILFAAKLAVSFSFYSFFNLGGNIVFLLIFAEVTVFCTLCLFRKKRLL